MIRGEHRSCCLSLRELFRVRSSQAEVETGNTLLDEIGEILRRRYRLGDYHLVFSERRFQRRPEPLGQRRVVVYGVRSFVAINQRLAGSTGRGGFRFGDAGDGGQNL